MKLDKKFVSGGRWRFFKEAMNRLLITGNGFIIFCIPIEQQIKWREKHVVPIETVFWKALSQYSNRCQSKWRTNEYSLAFLHSSTECGAFEKRSEWHTSLCSCQCLHTKRYNSSMLDWFCGWPNKVGVCIHKPVQKMCFKAQTPYPVNRNTSWISPRKSQFDISL